MMKRVPAIRGWQWVIMALRMARRWPGVFVIGGLIAAGAALVPLIGGLALVVFGPAYIAGLVIAAERAERGETPTLNDAFTLFREQGRVRSALPLCLPGVIAQVVSAVIAFTAVAHAAAQAGIDLRKTPSQAQMMRLFEMAADSLAGWALIVLAITLLAATFVALAIPRVALERKSAYQAMAESVRLVFGNIGAWLLAGLGLLLCTMLPAMLLIMLQAVLWAQIAVIAALYALLGPLLYHAWRDITGATASTADSGPVPPPPPSFEA